MKKILLILLVFISFIKVNALSIDKMYIDSEIDISGNLLVKEVIEINNLKTYTYEKDIVHIFSCSWIRNNRLFQ